MDLKLLKLGFSYRATQVDREQLVEPWYDSVIHWNDILRSKHPIGFIGNREPSSASAILFLAPMKDALKS